MPEIKDTVCLILNYAPHYRKAIFEKLIVEIGCDIYSGDKLNYNVRKIDFEDIGFKITELKTSWYFSKFAWIKGEIKLLFNKKYKIYILTGQLFFISDLFFIFLCLFTRKKVLLWNHGLYGNEGLVKKIFYKILYTWVDGAFLYSERGKQLLIENGIDKNKLYVIYNSLDYDMQKQLREIVIQKNYYKSKLFFKNNNLPVLIFIGRLKANKKLELLIKAVKELIKTNHPVNLIIVGDGEERLTLEHLAKTTKENIHFYGECYDEFENGRLIANANLCVSPGNVGLTAISCLSYGTPVCTHNSFEKQMPEVESIKEFQTGIFYNINDGNLSDAILKWFLNSPPRDYVRTYCYQVIDKYYNPITQIEIFKSALGKIQ